MLTWGLPSLLVALLIVAVMGRLALTPQQGRTGARGLTVLENVAITPVVPTDDQSGRVEQGATTSLVALRALAVREPQTAGGEPEAIPDTTSGIALDDSGESVENPENLPAGEPDVIPDEREAAAAASAESGGSGDSGESQSLDNSAEPVVQLPGTEETATPESTARPESTQDVAAEVVALQPTQESPAETTEPTIRAIASALPTATPSSTGTATATATETASPTATATVTPTEAATQTATWTTTTTATVEPTEPATVRPTPSVAPTSGTEAETPEPQVTFGTPTRTPTTSPTVSAVGTNIPQTIPLSSSENAVQSGIFWGGASLTLEPTVQQADDAKKVALRATVQAAWQTTTRTVTPTSEAAPSGTLQSSTAEGALAITQTPTSSQITTPIATSTARPTAPVVGSHRVRAGDTAVNVAAEYGLQLDELLAFNQLDPETAATLQVGQILLLPGIETSDESVQTYIVQPGDTIVGIALRFSVSTQALQQINNLTDRDARTLQPGQLLIIAADGESRTVAAQRVVTTRPTATPAPAARQYVIQSGDTPAAIAAQHGIDTQTLLAANGLTSAQARRLLPGQILLIPNNDSSTILSATAVPQSVSFQGASSTGGPDSTQAPVAYRLDPPQLLSPADDGTVSCSGSDRFLRWEPVSAAAATDSHVLFLGYVNGLPNEEGEEPIQWTLRQNMASRDSWRMDQTYCNLAPQELGRRWRWYIQVFDGDTAVSPPSEVWEFAWR